MQLYPAAVLVLTVIGCSPSHREPIVYPARDYPGRSSEDVRADIRDCEEMADTYDSDRSRYSDIAKSGVIGGAVGAGTGALAGTIMGESVGRSTGAGAAVGGIIGVLSGLRGSGNDSPSRERFIEHCLERRGYEVSGWR